MIVLRLTAAGQVHDITLPAEEAFLGSAPSADVTLQNAGWKAAMARCRLDANGRGLVVERLDGSGTKVLLQAGQCLAIGDALLEWVGSDVTAADQTTASGVLFGGYEDDPTARPTSSIAAATFSLEPRAATPETTAPPAATTPRGTMPRGTMPLGTTPLGTMPASAAFPETALPNTATTDASAAGKTSDETPSKEMTSNDVAATDKAPPPDIPVLAQAGTTTRTSDFAPSAPSSRNPKRTTRTDAQKEPQALTPAHFPAPDLGSELVGALKRSPFFVGSAAVHLLVFVLFTMLWDTSEPEPPVGIGSIRTSMADPESEMGDPEELDETDELNPMDFESVDLDEIIEQPDPKAPTSPTPDNQLLDAELDDTTTDAMADPQIGILPSDRVFHGRTPKLRKPTVAPSKLNQVFESRGALKTNRHVADLVRNMMSGNGGGPKGAGLDDIQKGDILVVKAAFDHMDIVLRALSIPFDTIISTDLSEPNRMNFQKYKIVFWNCGRPLKRATMRKIKGKVERFVRRGGYLFTTDWAAGGVLRDAFPGYIKTKGKTLKLPERVVEIMPKQTSRRNPLLEGVFSPGATGRWWLEEQSFDIEIGPRGKGIVEVLIEAPELRDVWGVNSAVAVTFNHSRGRVLHVMGHYYQQAGNVAGTMASHRLALNFVLECIGKHRSKNK